jgi:hypothetical protein
MWFALVTTGICVILAVVLHLAALRFQWRYARHRLMSLRGAGIVVMVLGCMVAHLLEIGVFALGLYVVAAWEGRAQLANEYLHENLDLWYYSAAFYTSLGADRPPTAGLRVLATCEALCGLMLITWTASFLFLLMQDAWGPEGTGGRNRGEPPPFQQKG